METVTDYLEPDVETQDVEKQGYPYFEALWSCSISSDDFLSRVHKHIDDWLDARHKRFEELWANAISGKEFERRMHKHIDEWYDARDKK